MVLTSKQLASTSLQAPACWSKYTHEILTSDLKVSSDLSMFSAQNFRNKPNSIHSCCLYFVNLNFTWQHNILLAALEELNKQWRSSQKRVLLTFQLFYILKLPIVAAQNLNRKESQIYKMSCSCRDRLNAHLRKAWHIFFCIWCQVQA